MPAGPFEGAVEKRRVFGTDWLILKKSPQVVGEVLGGLIAVVRILLNRLEYDGFELGRNGLVELARWAGIVEGDLAEDFGAVLAGKDGLEGEQLVERDAEGVDVAAVVDGDAFGQSLLGTHVAERA